MLLIVFGRFYNISIELILHLLNLNFDVWHFSHLCQWQIRLINCCSPILGFLGFESCDFSSLTNFISGVVSKFNCSSKHIILIKSQTRVLSLEERVENIAQPHFLGNFGVGFDIFLRIDYPIDIILQYNIQFLVLENHFEAESVGLCWEIKLVIVLCLHFFFSESFKNE